MPVLIVDPEPVVLGVSIGEFPTVQNRAIFIEDIIYVPVQLVIFERACDFDITSLLVIYEPALWLAVVKMAEINNLVDFVQNFYDFVGPNFVVFEKTAVFDFLRLFEVFHPKTVPLAPDHPAYVDQIPVRIIGP